MIVEETRTEDWKNYQPDVILVSLSNCIRIKFTKKAADAVNIYKRKNENDEWEFVATVVNSPFDDYDAEFNWEYCIKGVKEKEEVGIPVVLSVSL